MKRIFKCQVCQPGESHEFRCQLGPSQLHAVNIDQFAVRLNQARIELEGGLKSLLGEPDPVAPQLDLTRQQPRLCGHVVLVRNASEIFQCLIVLFSRDRELGAEEPVERRRRTRPFESAQGRFDARESVGRKVLFRLLPERVEALCVGANLPRGPVAHKQRDEHQTNKASPAAPPRAKPAT